MAYHHNRQDADKRTIAFFRSQRPELGSKFAAGRLSKQARQVAFDHERMRISLESVLNSDNLPSLPEIGMQVVRIVRQPEPDFAELIKTIKTDPAISSRILRTVNSAMFGLRRTVATIEAAVPVLGASMIRTLVLGFSLAGGRRSSDGSVASFQILWRHSLTQACMAEAIANREAKSTAPNCFLAGLLQDIGQLAILNCAAEKFQRLMRQDEFFVNPCEVERKQLGFSHVDVSAAMCRKWQFEESIVDAIASHHAPFVELAAKTDRPRSALSVAVNAAARGAELFQQLARGNLSSREQFEQQMWDVYRMSAADVSALLLDVETRVEQIADSFGVDIGQTPSIESILSDAQEALVEIAMQSQIEAISAKSRVEQATRELQAVTTLSQEIKQQANRDALTGVYNRGYLKDALQDEISDGVLNQRSMGILFLDIDKFKSVNDVFGHQAGDAAICTVANVLKKTTRPTDIVIRYGGDEFVALLCNLSEDNCRKVAERIRLAVSAAEVADWPQVKITTSIGAVFLTPSDLENCDPENLLSVTDHAMYQAKQKGRNQVVLIRASELNTADAGEITCKSPA